ncbi:MAG TPA: nucleotidyltransferase domain-containing protein [Anaerolineales bacterium]|nr:nucleotidyltransferase domain-containing protein [Anaerolineales bacterium]
MDYHRESQQIPHPQICGQIAEQFHPNKIILFGSYAYGKPSEDSDVDILAKALIRKKQPKP